MLCTSIFFVDQMMRDTADSNNPLKTLQKLDVPVELKVIDDVATVARHSSKWN